MQLTKAAPIANLEKPCKNKYILNTFLWTLLSSCISTTIILTMHHTPHVTYVKQTWIKWIIVLSILPPIYVMHISKYIIARKISYVCFTLAISMFASLSIMPILNNTVITTSITLTACLSCICIYCKWCVVSNADISYILPGIFGVIIEISIIALCALTYSCSIAGMLCSALFITCYLIINTWYIERIYIKRPYYDDIFKHPVYSASAIYADMIYLFS